MADHSYFKPPPQQADSEVERLVNCCMDDFGSVSFSAAAGGKRKVVVSWCCHEVTPVLQRGPMCGLVALTMAASQLLKLSLDALGPSDSLHPEGILQFAVERGLSRQGEMFSTSAMEDIISNHLHLKSRTVNMDVDSPNTARDILLATATSEEAVLVPYDADKDHTPCLAQGHSAHWCLLEGLCLVLDHPMIEGDKMISSKTAQLLQCCHPLDSNPAHYVLAGEEGRLEFVKLLKELDGKAVGELLDGNLVHVFARHGKSRHLGLWSLRSLLQSNRNLVQVDPKRSNAEEYVIPAGGLKEGLKNKVVIVTKK